MYSEQLETLIKNVLADGVITEKERAVLHKCAEAEDVDPDEIDVYIDGELDRIYNEQQKAKAQVRKCPACGEIIPVLTNICPSCGAAVNNKNDDDLLRLIKELTSKTTKVRQLVKIEEKYPHHWHEIDNLVISCEDNIREATLLYGDNKKVRDLISVLEIEVDAARKVQTQHKRIHQIVRIVKIIITVTCIFTPVILTFIYEDDYRLRILEIILGCFLGGFAAVFLNAVVEGFAEKIPHW